MDNESKETADSSGQNDQIRLSSDATLSYNIEQLSLTSFLDSDKSPSQKSIVETDLYEEFPSLEDEYCYEVLVAPDQFVDCSKPFQKQRLSNIKACILSQKSGEGKDLSDTGFTKVTEGRNESFDCGSLFHRNKEIESSAVPVDSHPKEQISLLLKTKKNYLKGKKPANLRQTSARLYFPFVISHITEKPAVSHKNRLKRFEIPDFVERVTSPLRGISLERSTNMIPKLDFRWLASKPEGGAHQTYSLGFWKDFLGNERWRTSYCNFIECLWTLPPKYIGKLFKLNCFPEEDLEKSDLDGLLSILRFETCWPQDARPSLLQQ